MLVEGEQAGAGGADDDPGVRRVHHHRVQPLPHRGAADGVAVRARAARRRRPRSGRPRRLTSTVPPGPARSQARSSAARTRCGERRRRSRRSPRRARRRPSAPSAASNSRWNSRRSGTSRTPACGYARDHRRGGRTRPSRRRPPGSRSPSRRASTTPRRSRRCRRIPPCSTTSATTRARPASGRAPGTAPSRCREHVVVVGTEGRLTVPDQRARRPSARRRPAGGSASRGRPTAGPKTAYASLWVWPST